MKTSRNTIGRQLLDIFNILATAAYLWMPLILFIYLLSPPAAPLYVLGFALNIAYWIKRFKESVRVE